LQTPPTCGIVVGGKGGEGPGTRQAASLELNPADGSTRTRKCIMAKKPKKKSNKKSK